MVNLSAAGENFAPPPPEPPLQKAVIHAPSTLITKQEFFSTVEKTETVFLSTNAYFFENHSVITLLMPSIYPDYKARKYIFFKIPQ